MSTHTVEKITSKFDDGSAVISYSLDQDAPTVTVLATDANGHDWSTTTIRPVVFRLSMTDCKSLA